MAAAQHLAALEEPVQYPGRMQTYPGKLKTDPPVFVHDCVLGCPGMPPRPRMPIEGRPPEGLATNGSAPQTNGGPAFQPSFPGQPQFPGQQMGGQMPPPGVIPQGGMMLGPNGEQIFFHPHYPQLRADLCKTCRLVFV